MNLTKKIASQEWDSTSSAYTYLYICTAQTDLTNNKQKVKKDNKQTKWSSMTNTLLNKQNKTKRKHPSFKVPPKLFQWNNKVHAALFFYYEQDSPKVDWILQWKSSFCMYAYDTCIYIYIHILKDEKNTIHVCGCLRACMCEVSVCVHECTCVID